MLALTHIFKSINDDFYNGIVYKTASDVAIGFYDQCDKMGNSVHLDAFRRDDLTN